MLGPPARHTSLQWRPTLLSKIFRCLGRRAGGIFAGTEVDGPRREAASISPAVRKKGFWCPGSQERLT